MCVWWMGGGVGSEWGVVSIYISIPVCLSMPDYISSQWGGGGVSEWGVVSIYISIPVCLSMPDYILSQLGGGGGRG